MKDELNQQCALLECWHRCRMNLISMPAANICSRNNGWEKCYSSHQQERRLMIGPRRGAWAIMGQNILQFIISRNASISRPAFCLEQQIMLRLCAPRKKKQSQNEKDNGQLWIINFPAVDNWILIFIKVSRNLGQAKSQSGFYLLKISSLMNHSV